MPRNVKMLNKNSMMKSPIAVNVGYEKRKDLGVSQIKVGHGIKS